MAAPTSLRAVCASSTLDIEATVLAVGIEAVGIEPVGQGQQNRGLAGLPGSAQDKVLLPVDELQDLVQIDALKRGNALALLGENGPLRVEVPHRSSSMAPPGRLAIRRRPPEKSQDWPAGLHPPHRDRCFRTRLADRRIRTSREMPRRGSSISR